MIYPADPKPLPPTTEGDVKPSLQAPEFRMSGWGVSSRYGRIVQGGYQAKHGNGQRPAPPTTGSGVKAADVNAALLNDFDRVLAQSSSTRLKPILVLWRGGPAVGLAILGVSAVVTVLGWFFFFVGMVKLWWR